MEYPIVISFDSHQQYRKISFAGSFAMETVWILSSRFFFIRKTANFSKPCERSLQKLNITVRQGFGFRMEHFSRGGAVNSVTTVTTKYRQKFEQSLKFKFEIKILSTRIQKFGAPYVCFSSTRAAVSGLLHCHAPAGREFDLRMHIFF